MVCLDKLLDFLGQSVFLRDLHAVRHVADDDLRAFLLVVHLGVRVLARLVLCEEGRVGHLTDVVVERARPHQHRVCADAAGGVGREVGDLHGVLETARSLLRELPEEGVVRVRQLHQCDVRHITEQFLHDVDERVGEQEQQTVAEEDREHRPLEMFQAVLVHQRVTHVDDAVGECDEYGGLHEL